MSSKVEMESLLFSIANAMEVHQFDDLTSLPSNVHQLRQIFRTFTCHLPEWIYQGPYPYIDPCVTPLIQELQAMSRSLAVSSAELNYDFNTRLIKMFPIILSDCSTLRSHVRNHMHSDTLLSTESFLVLVVRDAVALAHPPVLIHEGVAVALPCNPSGGFGPLLDYSACHVIAPLTVSLGINLAVTSSGDHDYSMVLADENEKYVTTHENDLDNYCSDSVRPSHGDDTSEPKSEMAEGDDYNDDDNRESKELSDKDACSEEYARCSEGENDDDAEGSDDESNQRKEEYSVNGSVEAQAEPYTMSEFAALGFIECPSVKEDSVDEPIDHRRETELDAHVLAYSPSRPLAKQCAVGALCMASDEDLPIIMTSILFQRRAWKILELVVGVAFSPYETTVSVFVGWLDDDEIIQGSQLPKPHMVRVSDPFDLVDPHSVLSFSWFIIQLESHFSGLCSAAQQNAVDVMHATTAGALLRWRLDSSWIQFQKCGGTSGSLVADWFDRCEQDLNRPRENLEQYQYENDPTSSPTDIEEKNSLCDPGSNSSSEMSPEEIEDEERSSIPQALPESSHPPVDYAKSFHDFMKDPEGDVKASLSLLDRNTSVTSLVHNTEMFWFYNDSVRLMWPSSWESLDKIPQVDNSVADLRKELWEEIDALKQKHPDRLIPDVPEDLLETLTSNFSSILHTCRSAKKYRLGGYDHAESQWRADLDRLHCNFLNSLLSEAKNVGEHGEAYKSGFVKMSTEQTLQFPRNWYLDDAHNGKPPPLARFNSTLYGPKVELIQPWLEHSGSPLSFAATKSLVYKINNPIVKHIGAWAKQLEFTSCCSRALQYPLQCQCDALATLCIPIDAVDPDQHALHFTIDSWKDRRRVPVTSGAAEMQSRRRGWTGSQSHPLTGAKKAAQETTVRSSRIDRSQLGSGPLHRSTCLELPLAIMAYDRASDVSPDLSTRRHRQYHMAAIHFLSLLGIVKSPVFGFVSHGPSVTIDASWMLPPTLHYNESALDATDREGYIYEGFADTVDLSSPLDAWRYATILCRIGRKRARNLRDEFSKVEESVISKMKGDYDDRWTMASQRAEYGMDPPEPQGADSSDQ